MSAQARSQVLAGHSGIARGLGLTLLCALLVVLFAAALFPYERFREPAVRALASATGAEVEIGDLAGGLGALGPAITARPLRLRWPDGRELALDRARVRPALSLSWLRGQPALAIELEGPGGRAAGTLWPDADGGFRGTLAGIDLATLPLAAWLGVGPDAGLGEAEIDLRLAAGAPHGSVRFAVLEGSLALPEIGFALPFASLRGVARLRDGGAMELVDLALEGPALAISGGGRVGAAARRDLAPLDLDLELAVVDQGLRPLVRSWGVRLDRAGRARVRITGTAGRPEIR